MARRAAAVALMLLMLAPGAVAAWNQPRGSEGRNAVLVSPPRALDVLRNDTVPLDGTLEPFRNAYMVETPAGLSAVIMHAGGCALLTYPDIREEEPTVREIPQCEGYAALQGYDSVTNAILLCRASRTDDIVLESRGLTSLERLWGVVPGRDLAAQALPFNDLGWTCNGAAIDEDARIAYVAFWSGYVQANTADHALAAISLDDGRPLWVQRIRATSVLSSLTPPNTYVPQAVTLTDTGVVVVGQEACYACRADNGNVVGGFAAWFSREGAASGYRSAKVPSVLEAQDELATRHPPASSFAVSTGATAALALGGYAVTINPEVQQVVAAAPIEAIEPTSAWNVWQTPVSFGNELAIPLPHSVTIVTTTQLETICSWSAGLDWVIIDMIGLEPGSVLIFQQRLTESPATQLVRLDASTCTVEARVPLRFVPEKGANDGAALMYGQFAFLDDGLVFMDNLGKFVVLGESPTPRRPGIEASTRFPLPGETVTLRAQAAENVSYVVAWDDGEVEEIGPEGIASHVYADRVARDVAVTALYADGTTATTILTLDVGGTPPRELSAIQKAFEPENQNLTFGVLGVLLTILGAVVTIGRTRARFARLERELAALEDIRLLTIQDPRGAVLALKAYRDRLPLDLARRRIDDSQYSVLDQRSARLLKVLRTRMFAPYDPRLSPRFHRLLDAAFEDAILQPSEAEILTAQLEQETSLSVSERAEVRRLLADFTSDHVELRLRP